MANKGESLKGLRIADYYSSLLHLSGFDITLQEYNKVFDGKGNTSGLTLSSRTVDEITVDRADIQNYILPCFTILDTNGPQVSYRLTFDSPQPPPPGVKILSTCPASTRSCALSAKSSPSRLFSPRSPW